MTDPKHRLTGATLAASLSRQQRKVTKDEWHDVVDGVDDPYIRAILRKIGGDSWEAVLSEDMALLDKITIAVCNLNDKEVSGSTCLYTLCRYPCPDPVSVVMWST
jgi:hypothetical protein